MPGVSGVLVYSCAFYQYQVHTRPRVQRASGIPHALWAEGNSNTSGAPRRENEVVCETIATSLRGALATKIPLFLCAARWIASRSLSSGAFEIGRAHV